MGVQRLNKCSSYREELSQHATDNRREMTRDGEGRAVMALTFMLQNGLNSGSHNQFTLRLV
jgi:hypothetical protein